MSITRRPNWFALLWTICPRTLPELSMKPFRRQKPIVSFVVWNSITRRSQSSHQVDVHCTARAHQVGARLSRPDQGVIMPAQVLDQVGALWCTDRPRDEVFVALRVQCGGGTLTGCHSGETIVGSVVPCLLD